MSDLLSGAIKSAVSAASGLIVSLPVVDPDHFSPTTLHGAWHLVALVGWVVVVNEARFWKEWADAANGK